MLEMEQRKLTSDWIEDVQFNKRYLANRKQADCSEYMDKFVSANKMTDARKVILFLIIEANISL